MNYNYDVHFDAENPDGTGCHFVFPVETFERACEVQREWVKTYQDVNTAITTVITSHDPRIPAKAA